MFILVWCYWDSPPCHGILVLIIFYLIKFIWLNYRSKQAEKQRDLAEEANRLFKQEFGDKIESLQQEVEHLQKQRYVPMFLSIFL